MVNVDCSRAGPGELSLEAALDSPPASPASSKPGRSGKSKFFPSCSIASVCSRCFTDMFLPPQLKGTIVKMNVKCCH